jgi:hypothetical protein
MGRPSISLHLIVLSILFLVGCGSARPIEPLDQPRNGSTIPTLNRSWMSPDAKTAWLLYVSDAANNEVYVYKYPENNLVGILTGFDNPHGLCVSKITGEILIANTNASNLLFYKHGEILPEATLDDKGQYPMGCSINTTGVAVSNMQTVNGGPGTVAVFPGGTTYPVTTMSKVDYLSYDGKGNIYVDGTDASDNFQFAELVKGKTKFIPVQLNQSIGRPGGVQLNGKYIVVGDESTNTVYLTNRGQVVGSTVLGGASEVAQFFVQGNSIIGPDDGDASIGIWTFPGGGSPLQVITGGYLSKPTGAAVSTTSR